MGINDRLSTILTQHAGEMAFVQRSHITKPKLSITPNTPAAGAASLLPVAGPAAIAPVAITRGGVLWVRGALMRCFTSAAVLLVLAFSATGASAQTVSLFPSGSGANSNEHALNAGRMLELRSTVTGLGNNPLYQWTPMPPMGATFPDLGISFTDFNEANLTITASRSARNGATFQVQLGVRAGAAEAPTIISRMITISNVSPTADAGSDQTVNEGTTVTLDGTGSDDPDGANFGLTYLWTQTAGPDVTLSNATVAQPTFIVPDIPPSASAPTSFTFSLRVSDPNSNTATDTVHIFIRPLFQETIDNPDNYSAGNEIMELTLPTALSVTGGTNTYTLSPVPPGLSFNGSNRRLSGTPTGTMRTQTFNLTYTATGSGGTDTLSFSITVTNAPPTGAPTISGDPTEGEELTVTANTTIINDANGFEVVSEGVPPEFTYQWNRRNGTTDTPISGEIESTYTLTADDIGEQITVTASFNDSVGRQESLTSDPTAAVAPANTTPTTTGLMVNVTEDAPHAFAAGQFNFVDADGDALHSLRIDTLPATGSLALSGTAVTAMDVIAVADISNLVYTPALNATADDTFTYSVSDSLAFSTSATATITITAVDDPPTITGTPATSVAEDSPYSFTPEDGDVDGDTLEYAITNRPSWATFDETSGALTGTPTNEHVGTTAGIIITVTDGIIATPVALPAFSIEVTNTNDAPTATELMVRVTENTDHTFTANTFSAVFVDVDVGDTLHSLRIDSLPTTGILALSGTAVTPMQVIPAADIPNLVYTPATDVIGNDSFTYSLSDGTVFSASATATLTITSASVPAPPPVPVAPVANAGEPQTVTEGATVTLNGSATDSDSDAAALSYAWTQTSGQQVTLSGADSASPSFTAPTGLSANAVLGFSLTVSDGSLSASASVSVTVTAVNDAPSVDAGDTGEPRTVAEGETVTLSGSATDPDTGDSLSYAWTQTSGPAVTLSGADSPSASFTAPTGLSADAMLSFLLTVSDGRLSASARVRITVTYVNDAPSADAGTDQSVDEGATVTLSGSGTDPDTGDSLSYAWTQTGGPTVSLNRANSASPSFTAPNVLSTDAVLTFRLTVTDPRGASDSDSVQVTIETAAGARQQALDITLAAFGRSVAASAVDAIGERFKPASAGPQTSTVSGLSLAACLSSIPNLISANTVTANSDSTASVHTASANTVSASTATVHTAGLGDLGSSGDLGNSGDSMGGLNRASADRQSDNPVGNACQLPDREQLARSAFVIPLGLNQNLSQNLNENDSTAEPSAQWSLWGRGDFSHFEGSPQSEFDLDGEVVSGYLGLDYRLETGALVGVALSHSSGETDYRSGETDGELETDLSSVYPYGYWSPRDGLGLWGLLGIGQGDATLSHGATTFETDLDMRLGALGLRQALHSTGEFELALKADAFIVELESEDVPGLPEVTAQARRARLLLEASRHWQVQPEASLSTSLELGVRVDGGDAEEGEGAEVGVGLEYANGRGLSTALRAHGLLAHKESDFEAWGASLTVQLDPGVSGQGLALTLTPVWGQDSGGGAQALWESERALQDSGLAQRPTARLELNLSYGLVQSDRLTRLRPFAQLDMADGIARRLRLGMQLERPDGLELEVFAGRNASEQRAPEHLLGLSGRLHF